MADDTAVREQMSRILGSPGFQNSERLSRFLRVAVEAKLRGEGEKIKEYLIGREVFDRNEDYDPRLDPIVRVEARRLRKKLDEFYATSPIKPGGLRIEFPKGSYTPEFSRVTTAAPHGSTVRIHHVAGWLAVGGATVFTFIWFRPLWHHDAALAVVPARWTWRAEDFPAVAYDEDLAELTGAELANRHAANLVAWPVLQKFRGGGYSLHQIAAELNLEKAFIVAVRVEADGFRVTAYMIDARSNRKLGVYDVPSQRLETIEQRRNVARELASAVTSNR